MDSKPCKWCLEEKDISQFYLNKGWLSNKCKSCAAIDSNKWRTANPDKTKTIRRKGKLKDKYNLSLEGYDALFIKNLGLCHICNKEHTRRPLNVDHCHTTGIVRGLLCDKCNLAIGLFNDDPMLLYKTIEYLKGNT